MNVYFDEQILTIAQQILNVAVVTIRMFLGPDTVSDHIRKKNSFVNYFSSRLILLISQCRLTDWNFNGTFSINAMASKCMWLQLKN